MANNPNKLIRKAYIYGMDHHSDTKNNIFQHWKTVLKQYNIKIELNKTKFSLDSLRGDKFNIHTDGSRMNNRTGMGINIYNLTSNESHKYSLRIHDQYSNNVAEICSILTAIKLLPKKAKAKIHTDSQVAIHVLEKNYKGMFHLLYKEFKETIRKKRLRITLIKVKGHEDTENIKVDQMAKESLEKESFFDIKQLLGERRILMKRKIVLFNPRELTKGRLKEKFLLKLDENPHQHDYPNPTSANVKYLKEKLSPNIKYAIWRNLTDSHIRHFTGSFCPDCEVESDLLHYLHECPKSDSARFFCEQKISSIINKPCIISRTPSWYDRQNSLLHVHPSGFLPPTTDATKYLPDLEKNWTQIQVLLTLFVGKCHKTYYSDKIITN
jgi:ribonuclease HI